MNDRVIRLDAHADRRATIVRGGVHGGPNLSIDGRISSVLLRVVDQLLIWQNRARERAHLRDLNDHMRKDLGLSRADIDREASKPFWQP